MIQLTKSQKNALLKLGCSSSHEVISIEVLNELVMLNLVYKRSDGNLDLTEMGESAYDKLASQDKRSKMKR